MITQKEQEDQDKKYNPAEQRHSSEGGHDNLGVHPERREAEVDDLENLYNAESRAYQDRNTTPNSSVDAEQNALSNNSDEGDEDDSSWKNSVSEKKQQRFKVTRKQATAGGGAAGLIIGGSVGFMVFMSGPLQFLQFAQILQRFHFGSSERFGNSRTAKLFRWATSRDPRAQDFNLSRGGNKLAVHYENKLRAQGLDIEYNGKVGRMSAINVDPETPAGKKFLQAIEAEHGVPLRPNPGDTKIHIAIAEDSSEIVSARGRRKITKGLTTASDMEGISKAMADRVLIKRSGVNWHPLQNIARSVDERTNLKFKEWGDKVKERWAEGIEKGSADVSVKASRQDDPDNPPTDAEKQGASQVDGEVDDIVDTAKDPNVSATEKSTLIKSKMGKGAVGAAAAIALLCGLDKIGEAAGELQESNVVQPLIRLATTGVISPASQIMSGQGISMDELGVLSESFYNKDNETSWMSAESIQYNLGKPDTGIKIPDSAKPGKDRPAFFEVIHTIVSVPVLKQTCSAMNTTVGMVAMTVANLAVSVTGVGTLVLQVGSEVVTQVVSNAFMDDVVKWIAGEAIDVSKISGGEFGAMADTGAFLADNNSSMALGGRALTDSERVALINENQADIRNNNRQKNYYARLFDLKSPDSLSSKTLLQNNSLHNPQATIASLVKSPFMFVSNVGSIVAGMNPKAFAQTTPYNYGVDKIGFSVEDRDNTLVENPFENEEKVKPMLEELNKKYGEVCFGSTVDPTSGKFNYTQAPSYKKLLENKAVCGSENKDPNFLRYRMYLADTATMNTMLCYNSIDEAACNDIGLGDSAPSSSSSQNNTESCAEGSTTVGPADGYINGTKQQITLCAINDLPVQAIDSDGAESTSGTKYFINGSNGKAMVSSTISGKVVEMIKKAKAEGINLIAISSFRTNEHQTESCKPNGSICGNGGYAMPGFSIHQSGEAIDFLDSNRNSTANCKNHMVGDRCVGTDPTWNWLSKNAENFGFKQLLKESWHWSTSGN